MINNKILYFFIILFFSVAVDLFGDYLWRKGVVKSVYIGGFHIDHEWVYLSIIVYLVLVWLGMI